MPPKSTAEATASEASAGIPQLPWSSIPKFTPGITNVQEYTQKLKFLAAMWPADFLDQLAPRAALLVEGTAFRKVARLDADKLKVKNSSGVAALVEAIGGSWGATDLKKGTSTLRRPFTAQCSVMTRVTTAFWLGWKVTSSSC